MRIVRSVVIVMAAALSGCANLGSEVIRSGRPAYNDAILATNDEQLLQNIVRMRFGDGLGFLTVSSVTANVSLTASGSVNLGFGSPSGYQGNLVPFGGTVGTEQNPTISYMPVSGDRVLRQLASETPLDLAILSIRAAHLPREAWVWLVRRVNDIRNPDFLDPPALDVDPRFDEVATLLSTLQHRGALYWARIEGTPPGFGFVVHGYARASAREAARLIELLGVAKPPREGGDVVVPMVLAAGDPEGDTVAIETRSLSAMMRLAAASIELPPDTVGAMRFGEAGPAGRAIRIRSSVDRPARSRVAVEYRGRWYYVDEADETSKQWFAMVTLLFSAQVPEPASAVAPMLTIPVAGRR
jgi:hypothetical protein